MRKIETKYIWETIDVIILLPIVGVNHHLPLLQISKRMVNLYSIYDCTNQLAIGYMINPPLHVNKLKISKIYI